MHWQFAGMISQVHWLHMLCHSVFELMNTVWWGIAIGIVMIGILGRIPREFVMSALGTRTGAAGIVRATLAGVLLDLCNHGVLMVGARLYERGASTGQVMAFLISSPWNSLSLTLILIALIGWSWTLAFIGLSMVIAVATGLLFDRLVSAGVLPGNPQQHDLPADFRFWPEARRQWQGVSLTSEYLWLTLRDGIKSSRMVVRWILFGVVLASLVRAFVSPEMFAAWFGPTLLGLGVTVLAATILEVCSEGSTPVAADILTRAEAPGNSFVFLMGGVATDYTEIMVIRETTNSWKVALFLPLLTLPQIIALGWLINQFAL
ncbi:MAG: permease [Pseudomonadota bacterium]